MITRTHRAATAGVVTFLAVTAAAAIAAPPASADNGSTLTVVGTSDVYDSNLVQSVIKPDFEKAYPNVTLNYISKGTGAAIAYAEAGSASALIVHAASVENQFVDQGYSTEKYGRAIFYGDYVLAGKASDPAGVAAADAHDTVGAFEKIAAAGADGSATFVSRGGTPGTTIQEHAIWALTTGVPTCTVSAANGGGTTPTTADAGATTGTRPDCPSTVVLPDWYKATGLTQGPNVINADTCNYQGRPGDSCYVFTDRGTLQYLQTQKTITTLGIVTRDNATGAPGGNTLLVNSFHAYGVNADKFAGNPNVQINTTAANQFLSYLTSPAAQAAIGAYLADSDGGAPFLPDAAPRITTSTLPTSVAGGSTVTVKGSISNVVPGTPKLSGVPVTVTYQPSIAGHGPVVFHTTTDDAGAFSTSILPAGTAKYTVSTGSISQIENDQLDPKFGDLLQATTAPAQGPVTVRGGLVMNTLVGGKGVISGKATVTPKDAYQDGSLQLWAAKLTKPASKPTFVASLPVPVGTKTLNYRYYLPAGSWQVQLHYVNNGVLTPGLGVLKTVKVS